MASSAACVDCTDASVALSLAMRAASLAPVTLRSTDTAFVAFALELTLAAMDDMAADWMTVRLALIASRMAVAGLVPLRMRLCWWLREREERVNE